jgi:anthranilate/para-aminobenzoate synthase component II
MPEGAHSHSRNATHLGVCFGKNLVHAIGARAQHVAGIYFGSTGFRRFHAQRSLRVHARNGLGQGIEYPTFYA